MNANATGFMLQTMFFLVNHNATNFMQTVFSDTTPEPIDPNETKCYGAYGCFPINYPWTSEQRAHSVFPFHPMILDIKFAAFTRKHRKSPKMLDLNDPITIIDAGMNPAHSIFFVTHGFLEYGGAPWIKELAEELLQHDKHATVIVIDWKSGSSPPYYQAVANIRLVGAVVAHMIFTIYEELKLPNLDKIHLIGHSLGAHMSGYAGYYLQRDFDLRLGRITGLDPASPYFAGTEEIVRLDPSDAAFVDVVHSDASMFVEGGFGIKQSIGHVDFFPNGGDNQPKCENSLNMACDHVHSVELFSESINSKCPFMAIACDSFEAFRRGQCSRCNRDGHHCVQFGFHSRHSYARLFAEGRPLGSQSLTTFLMTSAKEPFCRAHFKITVRVAANDESRLHGGEVGSLYLRLRNARAEGEKFIVNRQPVHFGPGMNHTFLAIGDDIEDVRSAFVDFRHKSTANPLTWRVYTPKVYIASIRLESMEHPSEGELTLCPNHGHAISSGEGLLFTEASCDYRRENSVK